MTLEDKQISEYIDELSPIDLRAKLWERGDFSFICTAKNEFGIEKTHKKQEEAFKILTSNTYEEFLYGGAAGGAKSWTGCAWLLFMCITFPDTKYFIARNELKDITDSVLVTWYKVCRAYGFTDFKFNAQKNFIQFGNGSHINFIELKYKPSDAMYEDVGSTEYTCGWIEEVGEIHPMGAKVISSRVGRHLNSKYGIKGIVFYTCNPKKNWAKVNFYDADRKGIIKPHRKFLPCLITENPFIEIDYVNKLKRLAEDDKSLYERLFKGNWEYEENPNALCEYEMIEEIWNNNHVEEGRLYITADVARYGSDKAVIMVWRGWKVVEMLTFDISKTTDIENAIMLLRRKYGIPKNRCVADADGVGGGVVDGSGILGFVNNSKAIPQKGKTQNYANLKTQCMYLLADKINAGGIWIDLDLNAENKLLINEELDQIQSANKDDRKLHCKSKDDIRGDIGRSPDFMDTLFMRFFFELKPTRRKGLGSKPRVN